MRHIITVILSAVFFPVCAWGLEIKCDGFTPGGFIPSKHTCDSLDISPGLEWSGIPSGTKSIALICDDPDAPSGVWSHWVIYNIPGGKNSLGENVEKKSRLDDGSLQGINDFGKSGYGGPCPPPGNPHRYFFRLFALDTELSLKEGPSREDVLKAIKGHVLAEAEVFGVYKR